MISKLKLILAVVILSMFLVKGNTVLADWWQRPDTRSTPPALPREDRLPTLQPTTPPSVPSPTPTTRVGGPSVTPAPTSTSGGGGSSEDPCAPGKSYTGSYCGWSPGVGEGGGGPAQPARVGGPKVLGLSKTSSGDLAPSDIILLTGVLCLLLYVRSKMRKVNPV